MKTTTQIINNFKSQRILVIGDLILDQYIQGSVSRISPEAPVPVVLQEDTYFKLGGSTNVSNNLSSLNAKVTQVGKIGHDDQDGKNLLKALKEKNINTAGVIKDKNMPTIVKTRIIARNQQMIRVDREKVNHKSDKKTNDQIFDFIKKNLNAHDAIIISDYGKGLITPELLSYVCSLAVSKKKIITVDPKDDHFSFYRKVTSITPNLKETENAIRNIKITSPELSSKLGIHFDKFKTDEEINLAGNELVKCLDLESLLITLSERGMRLFERGKKPVHIKAKVKDVYDVTGAGDTVISVFTLAMASGATKHQAAEIANICAGIVVGRMGAATVSKEELLAELKKIKSVC